MDPSEVARQDKVKSKFAMGNIYSAIAEELLIKDEMEGKSVATMSKKRSKLRIGDNRCTKYELELCGPFGPLQSAWQWPFSVGF